jgi:hypothetical protein
LVNEEFFFAINAIKKQGHVLTNTNQAAAGIDYVWRQRGFIADANMKVRTENWLTSPLELMNVSSVLSHVPRSAKYLQRDL